MKSLIFVYNAKSGMMNALFDVGHKIFNPKTYPCSLCTLTYDTFAENKTWKEFRKSSDTEMEFYHIDEFEARYPNYSFAYPIILAKAGHQLTPAVAKEELDAMATLDDLMSHLKSTFNL